MSQLSFRQLLRAIPALTLIALSLLLTGPIGPARAGPIIDSLGDFLPTYTGAQDAGLDVLAHEVTLVGDRLNFFGRMAGSIAPTQAVGGLYLIGMDRGLGTTRFLNSPAAPPIIGPNVKWDAIVRILPNGTGFYLNSLLGVTTPLSTSDISIIGNEFNVSIPVSLMLPSATKPPEEWTYNLWPRNGVGLNVQVSDLAPDDGNSPVHAVPEPVSLVACGIGALGLLGCRWRRKRYTARELVMRRQSKWNPMTKRSMTLAMATLLALFAPTPLARADIFQWEYINPANPSLGKQQSTTLCASGVSAEPGADLSFRGLGMAYLIGADLTGAKFGAAGLDNADLSEANLTNAYFGPGSFAGNPYSTYLDGANFTNAQVQGAVFHWTSLTAAQLYSTASYQAHDLTRIGFYRNNLTGRNFAGQNLTDANFSEATLNSANLTGANVRGANFSRDAEYGRGSGLTIAQLYSTSSYQAHDLTRINLGQNALAGVNLAGKNLTNASLNRAVLTGANLTGAEVRGAILYWTGITKSQLYSTASYIAHDLTGIALGQNNLSAANLAGQNLTNAGFHYATLTGASFNQANLTGASFYTAMLSGVSFNEANLTGAHSGSATLTGASFNQANLTGAYFGSAKLTNANISQLNLSSVKFEYAVLTGANLTGAEVRGTNFNRDYYYGGTGITVAQLYATASYVAHDLSGIGLAGSGLSGANLASQNLTNADFSSAALTGASFNLANLTDANLSSATLTNANFSQANLTNAGFSGATLSGANLTGAEVRGASFSGITAAQLYSTASYHAHDLTGTGLGGIDLTGGNLAGFNLTNANFSSATLTNANFSQANLTNAGFSGATLSGANLTGAEVRGASFNSIATAQLYSTASYGAHDLSGIGLGGNNLSGANLVSQNMTNANFGGATLTDANLTQANLTNANFHLATLYRANLSQANLTNANFSVDIYGSSDLTEANLTGANLANANFAGYSYPEYDDGNYLGEAIFPGANLSGANLSGADARGANFYLATLSGANTSNLIQSDGHIAGLDLTAGASLIVRDYDGNLPIVIDQHLAMNATGTLRLVFDADPWGSTTSFAPGIPVALGGTLELAFAPGVDVATQSGRTIDLFDWTGVTPTGAFTVASPYAWDLSQLYTTGQIRLVPTLEGDFNANGVVDAVDYTVWRDGLGSKYTQADYEVWKAHFGQSHGSGSAGASPSQVGVPEPPAFALAALAILGLPICRRRRCCGQ